MKLATSKIVSAIVILGPLYPQLVHSAGFEVIKPHRAVYDIKLDKASERSGIKMMKGRIVYEVRGNECDGISLKYRFLTSVSTGRDQFMSDQHTSTYESADGKDFNFITKSFLNEQLEETIKGRAQKTSQGINVKLVKPSEQEFDFSKAQFMTAYLVELIEKGRAGEHFLHGDLFDGSDGGDEVIKTSSVISAEKSVNDSKDGADEDIAEVLKGVKAWSISMSYFDKKSDQSSEILPIFESSFMLYENGVSGDLVMRYPDYSLKAKMVELEMFDYTPCKQGG